MPLARRRQFEPGDATRLLVTSRCHDGAMRFRPTGRRTDVERRVARVSSVFAVDVLAWAVLDNHWHGALRARPDRAARWSREEVARRWLTLHPMRAWRRRAGLAADAEPTEAEVAAWLESLDRDDARASRSTSGGVRGRGLAHAPSGDRGMVGLTVEDARLRLCDPSWFMREVNEPIARRFNRLDGRSGAFFGGRFHSRELLDEAAELAAAIYVDLNEWRAFTVELPELATSSSIARRVDAIRRSTDSGLPLVAGLTDAQYLAVLDAVARHERTGRSVGDNRFRSSGRKAKRALPAGTPSIFERLGLPRLDAEDAQFQELVLDFVRETIDDLERLDSACDSPATDGAVDPDTDAAGAPDASRSLSRARAERRSARRPTHSSRPAATNRLGRSPLDPRVLRSVVLAGVAVAGDGLHPRSSAIGEVAALEDAARRRGQSWVVGAIHRGRRATQRRVADWMHRRAIRARPRVAVRADE